MVDQIVDEYNRIHSELSSAKSKMERYIMEFNNSIGADGLKGSIDKAKTNLRHTHEPERSPSLVKHKDNMRSYYTEISRNYLKLAKGYLNIYDLCKEFELVNNGYIQTMDNFKIKVENLESGDLASLSRSGSSFIDRDGNPITLDIINQHFREIKEDIEYQRNIIYRDPRLSVLMESTSSLNCKNALKKYKDYAIQYNEIQRKLKKLGYTGGTIISEDLPPSPQLDTGKDFFTILNDIRVAGGAGRMAAQDRAAQEREQAAKDRMAREQAVRERVAREKAAQEEVAREQAERERVAREQAAQEEAARDQAAREQAAKLEEAKEQEQFDSFDRSYNKIVVEVERENERLQEILQKKVSFIVDAEKDILEHLRTVDNVDIEERVKKYDRLITQNKTQQQLYREIIENRKECGELLERILNELSTLKSTIKGSEELNKGNSELEKKKNELIVSITQYITDLKSFMENNKKTIDKYTSDLEFINQRMTKIEDGKKKADQEKADKNKAKAEAEAATPEVQHRAATNLQRVWRGSVSRKRLGDLLDAHNYSGEGDMEAKRRIREALKAEAEAADAAAAKKAADEKAATGLSMSVSSELTADQLAKKLKDLGRRDPRLQGLYEESLKTGQSVSGFKVDRSSVQLPDNESINDLLKQLGDDSETFGVIGKIMESKLIEINTDIESLKCEILFDFWFNNIFILHLKLSNCGWEDILEHLLKDIIKDNMNFKRLYWDNISDKLGKTGMELVDAIQEYGKLFCDDSSETEEILGILQELESNPTSDKTRSLMDKAAEILQRKQNSLNHNREIETFMKSRSTNDYIKGIMSEIKRPGNMGSDIIEKLKTWNTTYSKPLEKNPDCEGENNIKIVPVILEKEGKSIIGIKLVGNKISESLLNKKYNFIIESIKSSKGLYKTFNSIYSNSWKIKGSPTTTLISWLFENLGDITIPESQDGSIIIAMFPSNYNDNSVQLLKVMETSTLCANLEKYNERSNIKLKYNVDASQSDLELYINEYGETKEKLTGEIFIEPELSYSDYSKIESERIPCSIYYKYGILRRYISKEVLLKNYSNIGDEYKITQMLAFRSSSLDTLGITEHTPFPCKNIYDINSVHVKENIIKLYNGWLKNLVSKIIDSLTSSGTVNYETMKEILNKNTSKYLSVEDSDIPMFENIESFNKKFSTILSEFIKKMKETLDSSRKQVESAKVDIQSAQEQIVKDMRIQMESTQQTTSQYLKQIDSVKIYCREIIAGISGQVEEKEETDEVKKGIIKMLSNMEKIGEELDDQEASAETITMELIASFKKTSDILQEAEANYQAAEEDLSLALEAAEAEEAKAKEGLVAATAELQATKDAAAKAAKEAAAAAQAAATKAERNLNDASAAAEAAAAELQATKDAAAKAAKEAAAAADAALKSSNDKAAADKAAAEQLLSDTTKRLEDEAAAAKTAAAAELQTTKDDAAKAAKEAAAAADATLKSTTDQAAADKASAKQLLDQTRKRNQIATAAAVAAIEKKLGKQLKQLKQENTELKVAKEQTSLSANDLIRTIGGLKMDTTSIDASLAGLSRAVSSLTDSIGSLQQPQQSSTNSIEGFITSMQDFIKRMSEFQEQNDKLTEESDAIIESGKNLIRSSLVHARSVIKY